jgi:hypothetical protein
MKREIVIYWLIATVLIGGLTALTENLLRGIIEDPSGKPILELATQVQVMTFGAILPLLIVSAFALFVIWQKTANARR